MKMITKLNVASVLCSNKEKMKTLKFTAVRVVLFFHSASLNQLHFGPTQCYGISQLL